MSERKTLKPADGVKVRRPDGRHLAEAGEEVEITSFWTRRIAAGDVVEIKTTAPRAAKAAGDGQDKGNRE